MHYHGTPGEVNPCWCNQPGKGEPYGQVKRRARHLLESDTFDDEEFEPYQALRRVIEKLIDSTPQQTLSALCEVAEDSGV